IYHVTVRASDGANTSDQPITVTLTDLNDNAPVLTSSATPSVTADEPAADDLSPADAETVVGPTTFSIVGGADMGLFQLAVDGHHLKFISFPYTTLFRSIYHVTVRASDGANTTDQPITVTLTDLNDNAPVLTSSATPSV